MEYLYWLMAVAFCLFLLGIWFWLMLRIWKISAVGAVLTFFLGLPVFYFLFKYWGDQERDIREPFFANLGATVLAVAAALLLPAYQSAAEEPEESEQAPVAIKSNPEMDRWCHGKHDAEYSVDLGTCVAPEPGKPRKLFKPSGNAFVDLKQHFVVNGVQISELEINASTPQGQKLAQIPELAQLKQFEIGGNSAMPSVKMVGECRSAEGCMELATKIQQSGSPMAVASNGKLLFFAVAIMGDAQKINQAKIVFAQFPAS